MIYILNNGFELENINELLDSQEDVLLIDNNTNRIIVVNYTCAQVIKMIQERMNIDIVINKLSEIYETNKEIIEYDVMQIINLLIEEKIIHKE